MLLADPLLVDGRQVLIVVRYRVSVGLAPYFFFVSGSFVDPDTDTVLLRR
jgi:hypothetical protein